MNQNNLKNILITAAVALGLAGMARADVPLEPEPAATTVGQGLLGQQTAMLTYHYTNLDNAPVNAQGLNFGVNLPLSTGFDAVFNYDYDQADLFAGHRVTAQTVSADLRAFTALSWGKPYVEAGLGQLWVRDTPVGKDKSIVWRAAIGAEFQFAPTFTVTPYVQYVDAPDLGFSSDGTWNYGVKANYWVESQWAITAGLERNDDKDVKYTIGTNFRF